MEGLYSISGEYFIIRQGLLRMKIKIILFFTALFTWLVLNCSFRPFSLLTGIIVAVFVSALTSDIFTDKIQLPRSFKCYLRFLFQYLPLFIWECLKANIEGVWRVAHPDLPINPGIVKVKTRLKSEAALTFLANSLTLKPGTVTVDIDRENGFLYVHWADVKYQDIPQATKEIVRKFERVLERIFE